MFSERTRACLPGRYDYKKVEKNVDCSDLWIIFKELELRMYIPILFLFALR